MRLLNYPPHQIPSRAAEHIALLVLALIVALTGIIAFEIIRVSAFENLLGTMAMQGLLAIMALGAWAIFRMRRHRAERRAERFYEGLMSD